ncbi:MAG: DUF1850 domain-containing protein [Desulfotignum sp.]
MTRPAFTAAICLAGLVLLLVPVTWLMSPVGLELRITPVQEEFPILVLPMEPDERFTLHYVHSVENTPIWEEHSMDKTGTLYIEEERYEKFGAGMGKMPGVGRMVTKGNHEAIVDMHMPVGNFVLRVGSTGVNHTIIWRGRQFNLSEKVPHRAVRFSGQPVNMLHKIWHSHGWGKNPDHEWFGQKNSQRKTND